LVAVGLRPHGSQVAKLIATSDGVDPDPHGVQVQRLEAALAECVVAEQVLHCPDADRAGGAPTLAHKRLAGVLGAESAVSAPLRSRQQEVIGALLCVGGAAKLLPETTRDFLSAASEPIGSALMSVQRHEGGRLLRLGRAIASGASRSRLVAIVLALAAIGGVLSIPVPYRISAGCRLEPQERRLSPAPFDGLLETTHVAPGDVVATGQLLATMDGREVEWELAGVIADQQRAAKERDTYLASHEVARSLMSGLEVERLAARETLLRDRLARLKVCSPIDGIVLSGSLDRRENVPVTVGQSLYEIAPLAELRLEVEVPADEVSHIREGMPIEIRMHGLASEVRSGVIDRIRPGSEVRDGRNVFVAEVSIDNRTGDLRPGMKGSVRVIGDSHPLGWNLFHRPWDYLLRRFF
ncbi:MAG: HlyD family efflux transporter periplasmic adaptor subunit, partial [Planctomycetaceae bacterium]|nr:HlyD family efflux transporter periplasmic adaptor subunit [Planctomycetaceae bacterium]